MNKWVRKSIILANGKGYLDNLSRIYPVEVNIARKLPGYERQKIKKVFEKKGRKELILTLLNFSRFPIDDPYVGFLRRDITAIEKNPKTVKRISDYLFKIGIEGIVSGIQRPKSSSRQFGHYFKNYLRTLGCPILDTNGFLNYKGIAFLKGGDQALKKFAKQYLNYKGDKGLDLVFKKGKEFFIGEAKFISRSGGTQDKSFRETMAFIKKKGGKARHIAILDGVVWTTSNSSRRVGLYSSVQHLTENKLAMSALLLKEFIKSRD